MTCEDRFLSQLRQRGFRFTPQRRAILQVMHMLDTPETAELILQRATVITAGINRSTVYRTLEVLAELGFVAVIEAADGQRHYLLAGDEEPHIHLVCQSCGKVNAVSFTKHDSLATHLWDDHHFKINTRTFTISGICRDCFERLQLSGVQS